MRHIVPCIIVAAAIMTSSAFAQTTAAPEHSRPITVTRATRTQASIRIDGVLDETEWAKAEPCESFTQIDPHEGQPASQPTIVRVLYDDAALYIGARMRDSGKITKRLGRRDMDPGDSDWFKVLVDSYHDHRTAFGFEVNPAGVRRDEVRTIDSDDNSWDPVWEVATRVDSGGWTAELRIPLTQLRFSGAREQTWGIQFERIIGRINEDAVSTFIPKSERGGVPLFGHLTGIDGVRPTLRLEVLPYTMAKTAYVETGSNPFKHDPQNTANAGADLLYGISSNLTLNAAINPDFGQVEVDPAVVNLGVYETFFQEKRPFFIEGSEIFDFGANGTSGGQIFYSRRIGKAPSLTAPPALFTDVPDVTTILGAGKLSGKPGGWSVGVLEAVTAKEEARYQTSTIPDGRFPVEPLSNYVVGRARREWRGGQTIAGGIFTATNRDLTTPALQSTLHSSAYAGGVDFHHEWGNHMWALFGDGEVSRVAGSPEALIATQTRSNHYFQRPDATHLEVDSTATSMDGYSVNLQMAKQSGKHWRGQVGGALTSPKYEVNDLGFSYRTDRRDFETDLTYVENTPGHVWRRWNVSGTERIERNDAWQPIQSFTAASWFSETPTYWTLQMGATRYFQALDDRSTRGGPMMARPAHWAGNLGVTTDGRKTITGNLSLSGDSYEYGGWDWTASLALGAKSSSWNVSLGPALTRGFSTAQYVTTVPDSTNLAMYGADYVFAPLDQTTVSLETRVNLTFTPGLSLQVYAQPLLWSGDYGDLKQLVAPQSYTFAPYTNAAPNLDFNLRSLRGNAVLRWEWRTGSTLYLAWQQSREDVDGIGNFVFDRDRTAMFRTRPDDIFLVKVNYWLGV